MALTAVERTNIVKLTVALYNAAPGASGLSDFTTFYEANGRSLNALALNLTNNNIYKSLNPNTQIASEFATSVLSVYGLQDNTDAIAFVTSRFNSGVSKGQIAFEAALAVNNTTAATGDFATARAILNNKTLAAEAYSVALSGQATDIGTLKAVISNVTADSASVAAANTANFVAASQSLILTTGQDNLSGTAIADSFISTVAQNALGQQVNTLGSGDNLKGGGGVDTLSATITAGVFAGGLSANNASMPIQPATTSVEVIRLEAVNSTISGPNSNTAVYVNAKDLLGVTSIGSTRSDANLVIQNLTTKDNAGGMTRSLNDITVLMEYTGNSDARWAESDQAVFFDQDYLGSTRANFSNPRVDIRLMNEDKYDDDFSAGLRGTAIKALEGVFIGKLVVTVNGQVFNLGALINEQPLVGDLRFDFIKTYPELLAAVKDAIVLLKAANPTNAALQTLQATDGGTFLSDISPISLTRREGTSVSLTVDGSTNGTANTIAVVAQDLVLTPLIATPIRNSNRFERADNTPSAQSTEALPVKINLEKVGLAGDGGELVVGSMFKDGRNVFSSQYDGKGITKFDITVSGASDKPSSLSGLHSTGNNLKEVTVKTNVAQAGSFSSLTIGNSETDGNGFGAFPGQTPLGKILPGATFVPGVVTVPTAVNANALKDVRVFDAAGLKGDLTLFAGITAESVAKYMTVTDGAPQAADDNVQFVYTGGAGNDYINLNISNANLAVAGTTTREDFFLTVNGGAGNDEIITQIGDGTLGGTNWYANSKINANLTINAGEGNDTVRTIGSGDFVINAGGGNDTVYADNSNTSRAVYVFNALDGDAVTPGNQFNTTNLLSQPAATISAVNANLTVTFKGFNNATPIAIGNSAGALANVTITDLSINQAIKTAINLDPVLSKLLIAEDGPGRTLVVRSLADGADIGVADLGITFGSTPLLVNQNAVGLVLFSTAATATPALLDGYGGSFFGVNTVAQFATDFVNANVIGANSTAVADNIITPGLGNDVIVLGTGAFSNDMVTYSGTGNGNDTIVNFNSNFIPAGLTGFNGGVREVVQLTFSASNGASPGQTITFAGTTVNLSAPVTQGVSPGVDVAFQFAQAFQNPNGNWFATRVDSNVVTLSRVAPGELTDVAATDFGGTYLATSTPLANNGNGAIGIVTTVQGQNVPVTGTASTFTVNFNVPGTAAAAADSFTFDGVVVPYARGDGSISLTNKLSAAAFPNFNVVRGADNNSVIFTAKVVGATAIGTAADFDIGTNTVVGSIAGTVGTVTTTAAPTAVTFPALQGGQDYLNFAGYTLTGTGGTYGGAIVVGALATDKIGSYINLVESTTNAGEYTISLVDLGATSLLTDNSSLTIAVVDFGAMQAFTASNFLLSATVPTTVPVPTLPTTTVITGLAALPPTVVTQVPPVPPVTFTATAPAAVVEGLGATYTVTLTNASATATTTVNYAFTGTSTGAAGSTSATLGTDTGVVTLGAGAGVPAANTGTLTFAPGVTQQTFTVPFLSDNITEVGETVTLTLSPVIGSGVAVSGPATTAITDGAGRTQVTPAAGAVVQGAAGGDFTYNIASPTGSFNYTIPGFAALDRIAGAPGSGITPSLINSSFTDGNVTLQYVTPGNVVNIILTGLTSAQDGQLFSGPNDLNTVFGAGTFLV